MNGIELIKLIQEAKPELVPKGAAEKIQEFVGRKLSASESAEPAVAAAAMQQLD